MREAPAGGADLSSLSNEQLMQMKAIDDPTGSFWENTKAGAGKALTDLARGAGQFARDALTPSAQVILDAQAKKPRTVSDLIAPRQPVKLPNVADALGLPGQAEADEAKRLDAALMATGGGKTGYIGASAILAAPTVLAPGLNTPTGAGLVGGAMGALQPVGTGDSRAANAALGTAVAGATQTGAGVMTSALQRRAAAKAADISTQQAQGASRDAALKAGQDAGYVVPPTSVRPGLVNEALESVAGKISTAQSASGKNQRVTDTLAREALGLKKDSLLTEGSLADLRRQAGRAYEAIKNEPGRVKADAAFQQEVATLGRDFGDAAQVVPSAIKNEAVEALQADLAKGDWTPKAIIEAVKKLRFDAGKNYKAFDDPAKAALADAQRSAADALDALVERNLTAQGKGALATAYTDARTLIAKAHDVDAALMADGHVNAQVLARISQKKPFTDQLKTIADFAGSFPKAVQPPAKVAGAGVHALRPSIGAAAGTLVGGPVGAALGAGAGVAVPWTVRQALLSGAGQQMRATPSYGSAAGAQTIAQLLGSPTNRALLPQAAAGAAYQYRSKE